MSSACAGAVGRSRLSSGTTRSDARDSTDTRGLWGQRVASRAVYGRGFTMRYFAGVCVSASLVIGTLACERTGLPTEHPTAPSGQPEAGLYAEERPFWNLAQNVPGSAGFFLDTASGNIVVLLANLTQAEAAKVVLRSSLARELSRSRVRHPQARRGNGSDSSGRRALPQEFRR